MEKDVTLNLIRKADECINNGIPLIVHIFPCNEDDECDLSYSYTVGMHNLGYPELIITGLDGNIAHNILMNLLVDFRLNGVRNATGLNNDIIENYPAKVIRIANTESVRNEFMRLARVYYEEKGKDFNGMEILQVIWPDKDGKFPESSIDYIHQINFPLTQ